MNPEEYYPELRQTLEVIGRLIDRLRHDLDLVRRTLDMQRDFVDNTSHELKSPLTSILGFAQMLDEEEGLSPAQGIHWLYFAGRHAHDGRHREYSAAAKGRAAADG